MKKEEVYKHTWGLISLKHVSVTVRGCTTTSMYELLAFKDALELKLYQNTGRVESRGIGGRQAGQAMVLWRIVIYIHTQRKEGCCKCKRRTAKGIFVQGGLQAPCRNALRVSKSNMRDLCCTIFSCLLRLVCLGPNSRNDPLRCCCCFLSVFRSFLVSHEQP